MDTSVSKLQKKGCVIKYFRVHHQKPIHIGIVLIKNLSELIY